MRSIAIALILCGAASGVNTDVAPHAMSNTTTPTPFVASASGQYVGYDPSRAFNQTNAGADGWINNVTGSCWIQIDLGSAYTLYSYAVQPHETARAPKTWTFAGSNNGSTFTTLDTQTNITSWVASTTMTFTIASPGAYRYYRLTSSVNNGDATYTAISQMYLYTIESTWANTSLPSPVQSCNINSAACVFTNNVVSGNILFVAAHREATLSTPTDTRSTTFTLVDSSVASSVAMDSYLWCGVLGSSGADTITVTSADGVIAMEYPATAGFTCTKDTSINGVSGGSWPYAPVISTASNGDLLIAYMSGLGSTNQPVPHEGGAFVAVGMQNGADAGSLAYRYGALAGSEFAAFDNVPNVGVLNSPYIFASFKPSAATMITAALPSGSTSHSYSYTPQCIGGVGAYTWTASSLPSGLSINASTGAITGTPTGGTTTPTITCTGATSGSASLSSAPLTVNSSAGTMSVVSSVSIAGGGSTGSLGTVTSGNCVLIAVVTGRIAIYPPTDSLGTAFKYAGLHYFQSLASGWNLWYGVANSTGSDTLTVTTGHVGALAIQIANCQGFADVSAGNAGITPNSVTLSGTALTTLAPGSEIWSAVASLATGATYTAGTGFSTTGDASLANCCQGINATESTVGSYTPSFAQTGNSGGNWAIWGIALRPSTSGVVATSTRHKGQIF